MRKESMNRLGFRDSLNPATLVVERFKGFQSWDEGLLRHETKG
ncbi:MAG: hypothetical protein ACYCVD_06320 [Desulfitobacteriaceae bacterium]